MLVLNEAGQKEFIGGQEDWSVAQNLATNCADFLPDEEDEQCDEEQLSCYNCRYRRWTMKSFTCMAA